MTVIAWNADCNIPRSRDTSARLSRWAGGEFVQPSSSSFEMKLAGSLAGLVLMLAPLALAKAPPSYEKGVLLSMQSAKCGTEEKDAKSVTGEILGTASGLKNVQEV